MRSRRSTHGTGRAPPSLTTARRARRTPAYHPAHGSRPCSSATAPALAPVRSIRTLDPERATNYELGASDVFGDVNSGGTLLLGHQGQHPERLLRRQRQQLDHRFQRRRRAYGLELSADWDVTRTLRVGGNYTYIERDFDYRAASLDRTQAGARPNFTDIGAYTCSTSAPTTTSPTTSRPPAGVTNLLDQNYRGRRLPRARPPVLRHGAREVLMAYSPARAKLPVPAG